MLEFRADHHQDLGLPSFASSHHSPSILPLAENQQWGVPQVSESLQGQVRTHKTLGLIVMEGRNLKLHVVVERVRHNDEYVITNYKYYFWIHSITSSDPGPGYFVVSLSRAARHVSRVTFVVRITLCNLAHEHASLLYAKILTQPIFWLIINMHPLRRKRRSMKDETKPVPKNCASESDHTVLCNECTLKQAHLDNQ